MASEKLITVQRSGQERRIRASQLENWRYHGWTEKPKPKAKAKAKAAPKAKAGE